MHIFIFLQKIHMCISNYDNASIFDGWTQYGYIGRLNLRLET